MMKRYDTGSEWWKQNAKRHISVPKNPEWTRGYAFVSRILTTVYLETEAHSKAMIFTGNTDPAQEAKLHSPYIKHSSSIQLL